MQQLVVSGEMIGTNLLQLLMLSYNNTIISCSRSCSSSSWFTRARTHTRTRTHTHIYTRTRAHTRIHRNARARTHTVRLQGRRWCPTTGSCCPSSTSSRTTRCVRVRACVRERDRGREGLCPHRLQHLQEPQGACVRQGERTTVCVCVWCVWCVWCVCVVCE